MDVRGASCRSGWMTTSSRERPTQKTAGPDGAPPQRRRLNLSIQERLRRLRLDRDARRPTATEVRLRKEPSSRSWKVVGDDCRVAARSGGTKSPATERVPRALVER